MFSIGFSLERSIVINKPIEEVHQFIGDFNQWRTWSPWLIQEATCPVEIVGEPGTVGHQQTWKGERIGSGTMILAESTESTSINFDLEFFAPWKSKSKTQFIFEASENSHGHATTKVTWAMQSTLPFFLFFMKKMMIAFIGSDYDRGLKMIKDQLETGQVLSKVDIQGIKKHKGFHYVGFRHRCNIRDIKKIMGPCFQNLIDEKLPMPDLMITISHKFDMSTGDCELTGAFAYHQKPQFDVPTNMVFGEFPDHEALQVDHVGSYNHLSNGWATAKGYQHFAKIKSAKNIADYEVYRNSPVSVEEKDLLTSIMLPIKN